MSKRCCDEFESHWQNGGKRGFGILVWRDEDDARFRLEYRVADYGVNVEAEAKGAPVALSARISLTYCPWCGIFLCDRYQATIDELVRLDLEAIAG
jgi:hypothetical protein